MSPVVRCALFVLGLACTAACVSPQQKQTAPPPQKTPAVPLGLEGCPPAQPMRYRDVEFLFNNHCARCHTRSLGANDAAQRIFESTAYPFTTVEPERLGRTMVDQWRIRRGIDDAERCMVLSWWYAGALDNEGNPPPWPTR